MRARKSFCRLARFGLTTANASQLAQFYEDAFGCRRVAAEHLSGADFEKLMKVEGQAERVTLLLGREAIELVQFSNPGRPYPVNSSASDLIFQHFAIVVSDMTKAFQRLCAVEGWSSITQGGPQRLPQSSGGVTAFKFRDPEGHPLELLAFQAGNTPPKWRTERASDIFLGIDHSAICVADTAISSAFYENLSFEVLGHSLNRGAEQEKLDDVPEVRLDVIAIASTDPTPHIELLCYRSRLLRTPMMTKSNDIAATRLVLARDSDSTPRHVLDPDAHHLIIVPAVELRGPR